MRVSAPVGMKGSAQIVRGYRCILCARSCLSPLRRGGRSFSPQDPKNRVRNPVSRGASISKDEAKMKTTSSIISRIKARRAKRGGNGIEYFIVGSPMPWGIVEKRKPFLPNYVRSPQRKLTATTTAPHHIQARPASLPKTGASSPMRPYQPYKP